MSVAPIALFVYKRPAHVRWAIEALRRNELAEKSDLFVFSDAPKTPGAEEAVRKVRDYINTVTGFRSISILERDKNWGLANSIMDGVTQLCSKYGRVIVLEDDLLPSANFLEYMNNALDRYEDESRVMQISGHMFPVDLQVQTDAFFLPITTTWGWATWQRAWEKFDQDAGNYSQLMRDREMMSRFDLDGAYPCLTMLESVRAGKIDAWGIRWYLSVFMNDGLVLFPAQSLIENKGFDSEGTNCGPDTNSELLSQPTSVFRVVKFPSKVEVSEAEFKIVRDHLARTSRSRSLPTRILKRIIRILRNHRG